MTELDQATLAGHRLTQMLDDEAAAGRRRRLGKSLMEDLAQAQDEVCRLIRQRRELAEEHARALELVRTLANRSEAFRRLVRHMRLTWQPIDPSEAALKDNLTPLLESKKAEVERDAQWTQARDADIEQRVRPRGQGGGKR